MSEAKGEPEFQGLPAAPQPLPLLATATLISCHPVRVGVTEPTVSILQNICRVLGCRPQDLADFPEAMLTDQEWEEAERRNKGGGRR